jgi:hypothetical protein
MDPEQAIVVVFHSMEDLAKVLGFAGMDEVDHDFDKLVEQAAELWGRIGDASFHIFTPYEA